MYLHIVDDGSNVLELLDHLHGKLGRHGIEHYDILDEVLSQPSACSGAA